MEGGIRDCLVIEFAGLDYQTVLVCWIRNIEGYCVIMVHTFADILNAPRHWSGSEGILLILTPEGMRGKVFSLPFRITLMECRKSSL